jgi:hypothetical protein
LHVSEEIDNCPQTIVEISQQPHEPVDVDLFRLDVHPVARASTPTVERTNGRPGGHAVDRAARRLRPPPWMEESKIIFLGCW